MLSSNLHSGIRSFFSLTFSDQNCACISYSKSVSYEFLFPLYDVNFTFVTFSVVSGKRNTCISKGVHASVVYSNGCPSRFGFRPFTYRIFRKNIQVVNNFLPQ
jgi:hypothetical protein